MFCHQQLWRKAERSRGSRVGGGRPFSTVVRESFPEERASEQRPVDVREETVHTRQREHQVQRPCGWAGLSTSRSRKAQVARTE